MEYEFDLAAAEKVREFLEYYCVQSKHPWTGKPLQLLEWQWESIIKPLYGTYRVQRGPNGERLRRYNRAIIYCPKKVGKTTLLAGLSLYHLFEYPGSECYCIASDVQQASVLYDQAADFVELGPLAEATYGGREKRLWVKRHYKSIEDKKQKSKIKVLSSLPSGKSGFSANFIAYDELAEWNSTNARIIWDRLVNAGMARINSMQIVISTAQYDRSHLGYEQYKLACDIRDEKIKDPTTLPVIYSLDDNDDWQDEENWWRVCPSIGHTVSKDFYRSEFAKVKNSPSDETRFRTFLLCQWVGHTDQWVSSQKWSACGESFAEEDLHGLDATVAIDMARRSDLASYVLLIPKGEKVYLIPRFFIPRQNAKQKEKADKTQYSLWERQGHVVFTDGDVIDPSVIREHIAEDAKHFRIGEIRFDAYGMEETRQILEAEGYEMMEVTQNSPNMSPATAHLERLILDGRIRHNNNPCLNWCLGNTTVKIDSHDRIMLDKMRSRGRIDGVVATVIGLTGLLAESEDDWTGAFCGIIE
jgi:phage terminase large subunit-like protein